MSEQTPEQPPTPPQTEQPADTEDELIDGGVADEGAEAPPEQETQDDGETPEPDADQPDEDPEDVT